MEKVVCVRNLKKVYGSRGNITTALNGVDLDVEKGEFIGIMGPSGAGKTTLLNIISTIDKITSGKVIIGGKDICEFDEDSLSSFRKENLGFMFQDYNLLDTLTLGENIALPLALDKTKVKEIEKRLEYVANLLGIKEILNKYPYEVSGGQKQRAAAGRAIIINPKLILADEPTGALDSKASSSLLQALSDLNNNEGATILMVTHDAFAASFCKRVLFIKDGIMFSKLFAMILVKLMGFEVNITIIVPLKAVLRTIEVFLVLFAATSLSGYMIIYKVQLIDLFKAESKMQKQLRASLILTLLAVVLIGLGYLKAIRYDYGGYKEILVIVILTVSGTYLLFSSLVVYVGKLVKSKRGIFFRGTNIITFSNFIYKSRSNSRILATIAVLSACTITTVGASAAIYFDDKSSIYRMVPFSYVYEIKNSDLDKNIENVILKHKENKMKNSLEIEVKTAEGNYPNISRLESDGEEYTKSVDNVISVSTLNKLLKSLDKDGDISLNNDEVIHCFYKMYSDDIMEDPTGKIMFFNIYAQQVPLKIKQCIDYPVINKLLNKNNSILNVVVVSDEMYEKIQGDKEPVNLRLINVENPKNSRETTEEIIKTMSRSRVYNQNSYGDNSLDISCYSDEYSTRISEAGFTIFLITFVGMVFLICTGSMIFFKQLFEGNDDRSRYDILRKIGMSKKEIKITIFKQISIVFLLPLIVGISHSVVGMRILRPMLNINIWPPVLGVIGIYIIIYFIYYLLTVKYYSRIIYNKG